MLSAKWQPVCFSLKELTYFGLVMPCIFVNIGPGNVFLLDGTKPLPEPVLVYHQCPTAHKYILLNSIQN